jgi:phage tail-like protein
MATVINNRSTLVTDPIRNFRFLVTFQPHATPSTATSATGMGGITFGFTSVGGFGVTTDSIPYREGGYNTTVHQIPGQTSFSPVTMSRGVVLNSSQSWYWMKNLFRTVQGADSRAVDQDFRMDIEVKVLAHPIAYNPSAGTTDYANEDIVVQRFKVYNAWITTVAYSDLNAGDNAIMVEQIQLVHEGFEMTLGTDLTTSAATIQ